MNTSTVRKVESAEAEKLAVMGRLVAEVAHELNNPLAVVIGGTQLILSRLDETQTTFKDHLERVLRNAQRCKMILGNLRDYGRTIGKKDEIVILSDLIREAVHNVAYQYDMNGIEVALNFNEMADAQITGNQSALLSVFINLIRNARQAMGNNGRLIITIEKEDDLQLRINIHDTGIGMSTEQMAKLFRPFSSGWNSAVASRARKSLGISGLLPGDTEGAGIGLATSLGIIETHGGHMSAESEGEGKGATFTILLPYKLKEKK